MPHCSLMSMGTPLFYFKIEVIMWQIFSGQSLNKNLLSLLFQRNYLKPCRGVNVAPFWLACGHATLFWSKDHVGYNFVYNQVYNPLCLEPKMFVCVERRIVGEAAQYSGAEMSRYWQMEFDIVLWSWFTVDSASCLERGDCNLVILER